MPDFTGMDFDTLLAPKGHSCGCGLRHETGLRFLRIGAGAVRALPEALHAAGIRRPFVVMDENTKRAAFKLVEAALQAAGIPFAAYCFSGAHLEPDEWAVGSLLMAYPPESDGVLAVGSGVLNDCAKVLAHAAGVPQAVVATAPSMDGYASDSSSMIRSGVKVTLYNACPASIIADTDILRQAPERMLWAGLGDMLAKYVSLCEWRIDARINGMYYCEDVAALVRQGVEKVASNAARLMARDAGAVEAVMEGLVLSGVAMSFVKNSRPASGLEHYFSHIWEMMALERGEKADLHGIQVGVGTYLTIGLYEHIKALTPDPARALTAVQAFDEADWRENIRRVFGARADEVLVVEKRAHQNDPARHAHRLQTIAQSWDTLLAIMEEELIPFGALREMMEAMGMPMRPRDLGIADRDVRDALVYSRDIREKYLTSSLLWDLGQLSQAADAWLPPLL